MYIILTHPHPQLPPQVFCRGQALRPAPCLHADATYPSTCPRRTWHRSFMMAEAVPGGRAHGTARLPEHQLYHANAAVMRHEPLPWALQTYMRPYLYVKPGAWRQGACDADTVLTWPCGISLPGAD